MNQNNLGVACWWDKHPNYSGILYESSEDDSAEEFSEWAFRSKESDFQFTETLFKKAIFTFEKHMYYEFEETFQNYEKNFDVLEKILFNQNETITNSTSPLDYLQ